MPNFPSAGQVAGLFGVLTVTAMFYGLGSWLRVDIPVGLRIVAGWAIATIVILIAGAGANIPLSWAFIALLVLALAGMVRAGRPVANGVEIWRLILLALPMAIAVSAMSASQWDEFTNWLPNQRFLAEFDRFPRADLPPSLSVFPAYPFGLPIVGYFSGLVARSFVENAGAIFNTLLIGVLASLLASQIGFAQADEPGEKPGWGRLSLGLLAATLLNPTFVPKLVFTTYVDFTTAVALATMAWAVWRLAESLASGGPIDHARTLAWLGGLAFAVLVNLKQPNLVLGVTVIAGGGLASLIEKRPPAAIVASLSLRLLLPPLLAFILWRYHVMTQLVGGEFGFRPLVDWVWGDATTIGRQMLLVASKKGGYFGLMLIGTSFAVAGLVRQHRNPLLRLAIVVAVPFWAWNLFLFVSYLGSFDHGEARAVASYWRYNTQLGGLAMLFGVYGATRIWQRYVTWQPGRAVVSGACALVIAGPVLAQRVIDFDRAPPKEFIRAAANEVAGLVPNGSVLGTLDAKDNGEYMVFLRYALYRIGTVQYMGGIDWSSPAAITQAVENVRLTHLWVRGPGLPVIEALHLPMHSNATYLLERTSTGWRVVKEWPTTA